MRSSRTSIVLAGVACLVLAAALVYAADITISFTTGQSNYVRATSIPLANQRRCNAYPGTRVPSYPCTTADVTAAGCVPLPFSAATKKNPVFRSCTIYSQDFAGEQAFGADELYERKILDLEADRDQSYEASRAAWFAAPQAARDHACEDIGMPADCILVK